MLHGILNHSHYLYYTDIIIFNTLSQFVLTVKCKILIRNWSQ